MEKILKENLVEVQEHSKVLVDLKTEVQEHSKTLVDIKTEVKAHSRMLNEQVDFNNFVAQKFKN